jgi:hypothetical protein
VQTNNFDIQNLTIESTEWKIDLIYESYNSSQNYTANQTYDCKLEIGNESEWTSQLALICSKNGESLKNYLITGIDGSCYFHLSTEDDNSQSVKLLDNELIISLGFTLVSFDLDKMRLNWKIRPDMAEIFEFYELKEDFILRGELQIHRVDRNGNVKWSYGGRDIWVNPNGKKEVTIHEDEIELIDFESNRYFIDYNGKTI